VAIAGCSGPAAPTADNPVELTYWSWAGNMDKVVQLWNDEHPEIQVVVQKQDGGDPVVTKLLTAIEAGSGAPDLVQAEFQKVPTLVSSDALLDISQYVSDDLSSHFTDGTWSAVTLGGDAVYAVPQDTGPMMFFYRQDIFDSLGLTVPTTWDEYAQTARDIKAADPTKWLGTFTAQDAGWYAGLNQQAGASWWGIDGDAWSVGIDTPEAQKVADFWGGLVEEGVIDNKPLWTPEWNAGLNDGSQVGWLSAVWASGVLAGSAPDTAGLWAAAPLPQWDASAPATGNWGGSTTAVTTQSKHPAEAAEFAEWLNTDQGAVNAIVKEVGAYPADVKASPEALSTPPAFFPNQPDYYTLAGEVAATTAPFTYGPNVNVTYSAYNDEFAKAAEAKSKSAFVDALAAMQKITVDDLKKSGFTVK